MKFNGFLLLFFVLSVSLVTAGLDPNSTGANSQNYTTNFNNLVSNAISSNFNTTITFSDGTKSYLTVPEYDSSTTNLEANLVDTYSYISTANFSIYEIRSDLFSEVGVALGMSNSTNEFDYWFNTLQELDGCGYGKAPCWVKVRNGSTFYTNSSGNDTAIDGTVRSVQALLLASLNPHFNSSKQSEYETYALQLLADSYAYETITVTTTPTDYGNITRLPMGGGDCAGFGISCGTDIWSGYLPDVAFTYQLAYNISGNETYNLFARNVTAISLHLARINDTDGDGFGVMPFNFNYDGIGSSLSYTAGGDVNSYHYNPANEQWDDSDAPRFYMMGEIVSFANQTNTLNGVFLNASDFVSDWSISNGMTNGSSCLQYKYNGTFKSGTCQSGYYQNGFGGLLALYNNASTLQDKVDETLNHYSWSGMTFDSTSGGTGLTYRGVRTTKLLGFALGFDVTRVSASLPASEPESSSSTGIFCPTSSLNTIVGGFSEIAVFMSLALVLSIYALYSGRIESAEFYKLLGILVSIVVAVGLGVGIIGTIC